MTDDLIINKIMHYLRNYKVIQTMVRIGSAKSEHFPPSFKIW